jgi:hypothetical protein
MTSSEKRRYPDQSTVRIGGALIPAALARRARQFITPTTSPTRRMIVAMGPHGPMISIPANFRHDACLK